MGTPETPTCHKTVECTRKGTKTKQKHKLLDEGSNTQFHYMAYETIKRLPWNELEKKTSSNTSMEDKKKIWKDLEGWWRKM